MVLRHDAAGVLAVGQPAHAWLCGQFARAWGAERFGPVIPPGEVALAAEQHDIGMAQSDLAPERNPETGLPRTFMEMGAQANAQLWRDGPPCLAAQSRWAALLATMHGRRLYERVDLGRLAPEAAGTVRALLEESIARERRLTAALQSDPRTALTATAAVITRNSGLVWAWDTLSLALLLDWAPHTLASVPTADTGAVDLQLRAVAERDGLPTLSLDPWPFHDPDGVVVATEGRRLTTTFDSDLALARGLADARWETLRFALVPA